MFLHIAGLYFTCHVHGNTEFPRKIINMTSVSQAQDISSKRQLTRNLIFNVVSFAINFGISFFFTPYLIRVVGKEAYSFFPLVNNIIGYTSILTAAVGSMGGRFVTMRFYKNDIEGANQYFNSVWVANCILSAIFTVASIVAIIFISDILTVPQELETEVRWLFAFGALSLSLGLITGMLGMGTYVKNRLDLSASRSVLTNVIRVVLIFVLFYVFKPSIVYMSLSAFIAVLANVYLNLSFKRLLLPELTIAPKRYFSWSKIIEVTKSGIWNSLNQLGSILLNQMDLLITNLFIGAAATADFAIAKTAPSFILSLLAMLSGTFMPQFNILYAKGQISELIKSVSRSVSLISLIIGIPMGFLVVFGRSFFSLWVPDINSDTLYWLSTLSIAPLILGASINPVYGLYAATNRLKIPTIALLLGSSIQTVVIFIILKTTDLGIWTIPIVSGGQSIARNILFTTAYGGICLGQSWKAFFPALFKGVLGMIIVIAVAYGLQQFIVVDSWFSFFAALCVVGLISLALNFLIIFNNQDREIVINLVKSKIFKTN